MNARVGSLQFQHVMHDDLQKDKDLGLDPRWLRCSTNDMVNTHGGALRCMVNGLDMPILNGMQLFPSTRGTTCYSAGGRSSVSEVDTKTHKAPPNNKNLKKHISLYECPSKFLFEKWNDSE